MKEVIIAYMVLIASGGGEAAINDKIKEGWLPYGNIGCNISTCFQPMVKKEVIEEGKE